MIYLFDTSHHCPPLLAQSLCENRPWPPNQKVPIHNIRPKVCFDVLSNLRMETKLLKNIEISYSVSKFVFTQTIRIYRFIILN